MALLGKGALAIWHDPAPDAESEYNEWHSKEHMLERVGVPGFRRGLRYVAVAGAPKYLNLYEVDELATLTSKPYLDRLNDPTPWTRRVVPQVHNNSRTLCRVIASEGGVGICSFVLTLQLAAQPERAEELCAWLTADALPALAARPGIIWAHLLEGDLAASRSGSATQEKRLRGRADAAAERIALVGGYDPEALRAAHDGPLRPEQLVAHGAAAEPTLGLYQLVHAITEADLLA